MVIAKALELASTASGPESTIRLPPDTSSLDNDDFQRLVVELSRYGLTTNQAKLYVYLLGRMPTSVKEICKGLELNRVDVYRKLSELQRLGMVEVYLDVPKKFSAIDPAMAVASLVNRIELRVSNLKRLSSSLEKKLERFEVARKVFTSFPTKIRDGESYYKFGVGRGAYLHELTRQLRIAKNEVLHITSANGVRRGFINGICEEYKNAGERGVCVKLITEITKDNMRYTARLSEVVEIRHLDGLRFRAGISDESQAILCVDFNDDVSSKGDSDRFFVFKDPAVPLIMRFLFNHLWEDAICCKERMAKLGQKLV